MCLSGVVGSLQRCRWGLEEEQQVCDIAEPLLPFLCRLKLHPCSCSSVGTVALSWFEVAKDEMW